MPKRSHVKLEKEEREETAKVLAETLKPLLEDFLADPCDAHNVQRWYAAIGEGCPLWTLRGEYVQYAKQQTFGEPRRLITNINWHLMSRVSEDRDAVREFGRRGGMAKIFERLKRTSKGDPTSNFRKLSATDREGCAEFAPHYLVQAYRAALELSWVPGEDMPVWDRDPGFESFDDWDYLTDEAEAVEIVNELRDLVVERDLLPSGLERNEVQERIASYLKDIGVLRDRGDKASITNARPFVHQLGHECRVWLPVEAAYRDVSLSPAARANLRSWGCGDDPEAWAMRLAFPFLSAEELQNIQREDLQSDRDLIAVYLIAARVGSILNMRTVAEHAYGQTFAKSRRNKLAKYKRNPFLA